MAGKFCWMLAAGAAFALAPALVAAQEPTGGGTVTGRVIDRASQQPVPSAQVLLVGTPRGTLTGDDGRYRLTNVTPGAYQIRALRIGYQAATQPITVAAGQTATADFAVAQTVIEIDEVVVTATGERQRKRESGNTVATIQPAEETLTATSNFTDVLTARAPGVYVQQSGGTTGGGSRVRIRGANSVSLSNEPLLVIDGVRVNSETGSSTVGVGGQSPSRLNDINAEDIENVEILKGPAAAALYGTAAANGVIQITTRRGRAGSTRWEAHVEGGSIRDVTDYPANFRRIGTLGTTGTGTRTTNCSLDAEARRLCTPKPDSIVSFNPLEQASPFVQGYRSGFGLNASGGSDIATYFVSGDFEREQGVFEVSKLRRTNLRANLRGQLRDNLDVSVNTGYLQSRLGLPQNDNNTLGFISAGLLGNAFDDTTGARPGRGYLNGLSPTQTSNIQVKQNIERYTSSINANWQPIRWLTAVSTVGLDLVNRQDYQTVQANRVFFGSLPEGQRSSNPFRIYNYTANGGLTGNWTVTDALRSSTSVGAQFNRELIQGTTAFGAKLTVGTGSLGGTSARFAVNEVNTDNKTVGGYFQEQLAWNDRVFLVGAVRTDNNSAFGQRFGYITYPSGSLSWVVSEEPFFPKTNWVSSLRLRAAYGRSGQRPNFRDAIDFFNPVTVTLGGTDIPGIVIAGVGNSSLKPELSTETEYGFEASFFNNRLGTEFTYYDKTTEDALIARPLPPSGGASINRFENLGRVTNKGLEYQASLAVLDSRPIKLDLVLAGSTNRNRLEQLGEGIIPVVFGSQQHREGFPLGSYFQRPYTFSDKNNDGIISRVNCPGQTQVAGGPACEIELGMLDTIFVRGQPVATFPYAGNPLPKREWSFSPSVQFFNFLKVSALLDRKEGFQLFNNTDRFRCNFSNCRELSDPRAPLADQAAALGQFLGTDFGYIEDADYTKLREVAVTLTASRGLASRVRAGGVSLTLAGRNLKTWTDYSGFDPEVNSTPTANFSSSDFLTQPPTRQFTARLNFTW